MAHPSARCSHEENRSKICAPCGRKIVVGRKTLDHFLISARFCGLIKKFLCEDFAITDSKYPLSICGTCSLTLNEMERGITKRPAICFPNYGDIILQKETRRNSVLAAECFCYICITARSFAHQTLSKGRGNIRKPVKRIDANNGVSGILSRKIERVSISDDQKSQKKRSGNGNDATLQICKKCFQEVSRGKNHPCVKPNNTAACSVNIVKLMDKLPENRKMQVVSDAINEKITETLTPGQTRIPVGIELNLNTRGPKTTICVKPRREKSPEFPVESLANFKTNTGSSYNQMKKFVTFVRQYAGKKSVPSFAVQQISIKDKALSDFYFDSEFEFDTPGSKGPREKRPCIWADAQELVEAVVDERKLVGSYTVKVMADGGQGFFKVCFSLLPDTDSDLDVPDDTLGEPETKKPKMEHVGTKAKLTSVKRTIILCIVPDIKETYYNLHFLFNLININRISFRFVSDFKVLLIINGQQTATSSFPCPYCYVPLKDLRNADNAQSEKSLTLKTYGDLKEDYQRFCALGKNIKQAKESHSTVNLPIFNENDDTYVLEKCIIPELHILQGFVNHVFWDGLVPLLGRNTALLWPEKLNLVQKGYHGEVFEGNACRKLLKEADKLKDPEILINVNELQVLPFIRALQIMNRIVDSCFSTKAVDAHLERHIRELESVFKATGLTETLKIHVLVAHISECVQFLEGEGLGTWSEQAGESIHREFLKFWEKYKINAINAPQYLTRLKAAVTEFSSSHL